MKEEHMNSLDKMEEEKMWKSLPCPFCGSVNISEGEVLSAHPNYTTTQSMCRECGALGPEARLDGKVDYGDVKATEAWNKRTDNSAILEDYYRLAKLCEKQAEEIERLQQQVSMLAELFCVQNITAAAQKYFKEHDTKVRFAYRKELLPKMVDRFLSWKLPKDFSPDAGITFTPEYNKEYMASLGKPPSRHEPMGTNLLNAAQAEDMCAVLLGGMSDEQVDEMVTALRVSFFKGDRK